MKITENYLRKLIKKTLREGFGGYGQLNEVDVADLIDFAKAYVELGWAVQEQFDDLLNHDFDGLNPNAVDLIEEKIGHFHEEISTCIEEYKKDRDGGYEPAEEGSQEAEEEDKGDTMPKGL